MADFTFADDRDKTILVELETTSAKLLNLAMVVKQWTGHYRPIIPSNEIDLIIARLELVKKYLAL